MLPKEKVATSHGWQWHSPVGQRGSDPWKLPGLVLSYSLILHSLAELHLTHSSMLLTTALHEIPSPCRGKWRAKGKSFMANLAWCVIIMLLLPACKIRTLIWIQLQAILNVQSLRTALINPGPQVLWDQWCHLFKIPLRIFFLSLFLPFSHFSLWIRSTPAFIINTLLSFSALCTLGSLFTHSEGAWRMSHFL